MKGCTLDTIQSMPLPILRVWLPPHVTHCEEDRPPCDRPGKHGAQDAPAVCGEQNLALGAYTDFKEITS